MGENKKNRKFRPDIHLSMFGKLLVGIAIIMLLVITISAVGLKSISDLNDSSDAIFNESLVHYNLHSLKLELSQLLMPVNDYLVHGNNVEKKNYNMLLEKILSQLKTCYDIADKSTALEYLKEYKKSLTEINGYAERIFNIEKPVSDFQGAVMMERMDMIADETIEIFDEYLYNALLEMEARLKENRSTTIRAHQMIIIVGLITAFALLIGGFFYVREITDPIKKLLLTTEKIKSGDLNVKADISTITRGEIEKLTDSFNKMITEIDRNMISRRYFNSILERMLDSLIITGEEEEIRIVNKATLELLKYKESELVGQPLEVILRKQEPHENVNNILNTYYTKKGNAITVLFSRSVIKDNMNKFAGMICIACCATEEQKESDQVMHDKGNTIVRNIRAIGETPLTSRELEIIKLIAEGFSSREIAEMLFISVRTVETHRRNLMQKLHSKSVISLVHYAFQNGLI